MLSSCKKLAAVIVATIGMLVGGTDALRAQQPALCDSTASMAALLESVLDRETRVPIAGVALTASWQDAGEKIARAVTDSLGHAVLCASPNQPLTLRAAYYNLKFPAQAARLTMARPTSHSFVVDIPAVYVRGTVIDQATGNPVRDAAVRLANTPLATLSDAEGKFVFEQVPMRDYTLRIEHIAYATIGSPISVRHEDLDVAIRVAPAAIPIEPIVVTAFSRRLERAGFYERKRHGVGMFIDRKQVDAMNAQNASDLLRRIPSLRLVPQIARRHASDQPRNTTTGRGNCRFKFIIDGTRTLPDFEMDGIAAPAIEGVEIYNGLSEVPASFRAIGASDAGANAICGVIAVWTRDSR